MDVAGEREALATGIDEKLARRLEVLSSGWVESGEP